MNRPIKVQLSAVRPTHSVVDLGSARLHGSFKQIRNTQLTDLVILGRLINE